MLHSVFHLVLIGCVFLKLAEGQEYNCIYDPGHFIVTVDDEYDCVILDCMNITANASRYTFEGWILSDVTFLNGSYDDDKYTIMYDNWTIAIRNITRQDTGFYHCVLTSDTGRLYLVRMGLNVKGPFFISGWEEYEKNTIVGLSAFASFIVLIVIGELLWKFRYRADDDDKTDCGDVRANDIDFEKKLSPLQGVELRTTPRGHPAVPAYVPCQDVPIRSTANLPEIRKRSPGADTKIDKRKERVDQLPVGADNVAFVPDYKSPAVDSGYVDAETTSL